MASGTLTGARVLTETPDLGRSVQTSRLLLNLGEVLASSAVDGARRSRRTCSGAPSNLHIERHQPVVGGSRLLMSLSLTESHSLRPFSLFTETGWPCCALSAQYHGPSVTLCQESRTEESRSGEEVDRRQSPISARRATAGCVRGARARSRQVHQCAATSPCSGTRTSSHHCPRSARPSRPETG